MYTLVIGGAYPYMDLNAKYEKLTTMFYYDWLEKLTGEKDKYI
jgi:hypothetical protein